MSENVFEELKRYVQFGEQDEAALRAFAPVAKRHFLRITDHFYERLRQHEHARTVFSGPEQVERLKGTLQEWLTLLFSGPWDTAYYELRARIGGMHVKIGLPQRYMFGAMNVIRVQLVDIVAHELPSAEQRASLVRALHKIIDLELAIMLETYREAIVEHVQTVERREREHVERQLVLSNARYDEIVEKAEALITTLDRDGRILLFNAKAERVTGLSRNEAAGRNWMEVFATEADRELVRANHRDVLRGVPVGSYEGMVVSPAAEHSRVRWHFTTLPDHAEPALCAIGIDVTNEHDLGVRSRRSERLASLGTMAAGLAHELRNPLNAAHLQLSLARRRLSRITSPEIESVQSPIALAESEMKRLAGLVEDFLRFARPQPLRLSHVDLRSTAEVIVSLMGQEAAQAGVALALDPGAPVLLEFDDERMKQVLLNLVRNAVEASGPGGAVRVQVERAAGAAQLRVLDSGPGIPGDVPIFEPFFTTKEQGTGLGLSIVHRIVMDHGGSIGVESAPGRTLISIELPIARSAVKHP